MPVARPGGRVLVDVPADRRPCAAGADDSIVIPGLPPKIGPTRRPDAFGAHRFVLAHDGPQRMGTQPEFVGCVGVFIRMLVPFRARRCVPPGRIYAVGLGGFVRWDRVVVPRGFGGNADQSVHVVRHDDPCAQPHVRPNRRRTPPFLRRNAPGGRQSDNAAAHPTEIRATIRRANRDEIPRRSAVIPFVEAEGVRTIAVVSTIRRGGHGGAAGLRNVGALQTHARPVV